MEKSKDYNSLSVCCLLIVSLLVSTLLVSAQEAEESRHIIQLIQSVSEKKSLPDARNLVEKVVDNYNKMSYQKADFYHYNLYRKTSIDVVLHKDSIEEQLNDLRNSSDLISKFVMRPFDFSFNYARPYGYTNEANITLLLYEDYKSLYADNIDRRKGQTIHGAQNHGIFETIGHRNIASFLDEILGEIDLFKDHSNIMLLPFKGPLYKSNINTYTYKLVGKKDINGVLCNEVAFFCKNIKENAFAGSLYISHDDSPRLVKAQFTFNSQENTNFLKDILLIHTFDKQGSVVVPTKQESILLVGGDADRMMAVRRVDVFENYKYGTPSPDLKWRTVREKNYFRRDSTYWTDIRPIPLTQSQQQIGNLELAADSSRRFKRLERVIALALNVSYSLGGVHGPVELGPLTHFVSHNDMEGLRLRVGGNTTINFSDQFQLGGYLAYGTRDKWWKYQGNMVYSLQPKERYLWEYPKKLVSFTYASDFNIPGQDMLQMNRDHFAQSFAHAPTNNMSLQRIGLLTFESENSGNLTYKIGAKVTYDRPMGVVKYMQVPSPMDTTVVDHITSSDLIVSLRFAPGERFIQRREKRTAIRRAFFELDVTYRKGMKDLLGADYGYDIVNFVFFRRFALPRNLAQIDAYLSGGKIWGRVPFPLLFIPEGNQSYVFNSRAYNVMNFYEFATDQFVAASFNTVLDWSPVRLFNPKSKIRMGLGSKIIYGPLSRANDPRYHPDLFLFNNGIGPLGNKPYAEVNIGLANIFNIIRVDYARRLTYTHSNNHAAGNPITNGSLLFSGSFAF